MLSMIVGWAAVAHAQVPNGDFATGDLTSWAAGGVGDDIAVVAEGTSFSAGPYTDTRDVLFPSAPYAARLTAAPGAGALATLSQTVEIVRPTLRIDHRAEAPWLDLHLEVRPTSGAAVTLVPLAPAVGAFATVELDLSGLCGATARVELQAAPLPDDEGAWSAWYLLVDDVRLEGDVCPEYLDLDGDGWCSGGADLDGDGLCDATAEAGTFDHDCDDANAGVHPDVDEVAGDGVDQDCDAIDLCYLDADGDGYGGPTTAPGDDAICGNTAGEAASTADCDDADGSAYPGGIERTGDGVDGDCDGRETCWTDADGDGVGVHTPVDSDDADCSDPGEATTLGDPDDTVAGEPQPEPEPEPATPPGEDAKEGGCAHAPAPAWLALLALAAARRSVKRSASPEGR